MCIFVTLLFFLIKMKKILLAAGVLLMSFNAVYGGKPQVAREDQVLLTIDKKPVTVGEFEYLYNKNNAQQAAPQSIDDYLEMFVNYKLKVAEAEAAGIDTTAAFKDEYSGYARELAEPYLYDKEAENKLIKDLFDRMSEDVEVSHIMLFLGQTPAEADRNRQLLDSIRTEIVNGADFAQMAHDYSIDRSTVDGGGYMGFIKANRYPYTFDDAAYTTEVGGISPVIETPYGYHIVKVHSRRPAVGYVTVRHILKLTQGASDEVKARKKAEIDSICALIADGGDFAAIAAAESDDPGSARQGGMLPEFTTGMMVPAFEKKSFELADQEIGVVESEFGYHIIQKLGSRDQEDFETVAPMLKQMITRDGRIEIPRKAKIEELKGRYNFSVNRPAMAMVESVIRNNGGYNENTISSLGSMPAPLATFDGGQVLLNEVVAGLAPMGDLAPERAFGLFKDRFDMMADEALINRAVVDLPSTNAEYRNLLNEYRDGMLLFEISDRKVWSRAKDDVNGLQQWFEKHRDRYTWDQPKFKSYVIFACNDSVMTVVNDYLAENEVAGKNLADALKTLCGKNVRVERVIAHKGENAIVDYLGFDGEKPQGNAKWPAFVAYESKIIDAPEEVADERGAITTDYQAELEEAWVREMRRHHKVKVDKKVLKSLK